MTHHTIHVLSQKFRHSIRRAHRALSVALAIVVGTSGIVGTTEAKNEALRDLRDFVVEEAAQAVFAGITAGLIDEIIKRNKARPPFILAAGSIVWSEADGWQVVPGVALTGKNLDTFENRYDALQLLTEARREQNAGNIGTAISRYEKVIKKYPATPLSCEAHFQCGVLYFKRRQFQDAFENLNIVVRQHPEYPRFDDVLDCQFLVATAIKNGKRPRLWGWLPWFTDDGRGLEYFEQINRNAPHGVYSDRALYDKGILALEMWSQKTPEAIDAFERLIYNYPESPLVPDAYLALARTYEESIPGSEWDLGAARNALFYYSEFVNRYPTHAKAPVAVESVRRIREILAQNRYDLALFYYEHRNNARAAAILFNEAINAAPESKTARDARAKLADINAGILAQRGVMDWIFGRYPVTRDASYIDTSAQQNLEDMGFGGTKPAQPTQPAQTGQTKQPTQQPAQPTPPAQPPAQTAQPAR